MRNLEKPRILIAYTTSRQEPFASLEKSGALDTWTNHVPPNCTIISLEAKNSTRFSILHGYSIIFERFRWGRFGRPLTIAARLFGKPSSFYIPRSFKYGSSLVFNIPEGLSFLGFKLLGAIDYMIQNNFDFLVYTNLSSYVNAKRISEILSVVDASQNFYAGKKLPSDINQGISGSFVVLSRETCKNVKINRLAWNHAYLDDIALLKLTKRIKVEPTYLESLGILDPNQVKSRTPEELLQYPHFKCGPQYSGRLRTDYLVMQQLDCVLFPSSKNSKWLQSP